MTSHDDLTRMVVSIEGCWSLKAWRTARRCRQQDIPYILTPRRRLEPWHTDSHSWLWRLPLLLVQRSMVKHAKAIRALTDQERRHLLRMTLTGVAGKAVRPWNVNVVTVAEHPSAAATADPAHAADSLDKLRRMVVDTHPFLCMTAEEIAAENRMLQAGIDSRNTKDDGSARADVPAVSDETWRKIQLHAADEGVADIIAGYGDTVNATRLTKATSKNTAPLPRDNALDWPLHLEEVSDEEKATAADTLVCTLLLNLRHELRRGTASKRHLADIYELLRYTDYDEDRVTRMLGRLNILRFTRRMTTILADTFGLGEGFAPAPSLDDSGTNRLRRRLHNLQIT